jgi:hypothetical protein
MQRKQQVGECLVHFWLVLVFFGQWFFGPVIAQVVGWEKPDPTME